MTRLLTGPQALRGRAMLDMPLQGFDFRQSRAFWGIHEPGDGVPGQCGARRAARLPGSPGRREPLQHGRVLGLAHEWSPQPVPCAVPRSRVPPERGSEPRGPRALPVDHRGHRVRAVDQAGRGGRLGRPDTALDHPLGQLERAQFIIRDSDLLRPTRPAPARSRPAHALPFRRTPARSRPFRGATHGGGLGGCPAPVQIADPGAQAVRRQRRKQFGLGLRRCSAGCRNPPRWASPISVITPIFGDATLRPARRSRRDGFHNSSTA